MKGRDIRKWIEAGFKDYGKDPWFFIRELAQNSRDAGATTIRVQAGRTTQDNEILVFEDDGCGMSYDHAGRYLFRLYASSKDNQKNAAGMFGIGFWTVLKFDPERLIIESAAGDDRWAVQVDKDLNTTPIACQLDGRGTRITLIRPPKEKTAADFTHKIEEALNHYCSYLRRNTPDAPPLPVLISGKDITQPMGLPGPVSLTFRKGPVEGVVGLAALPEVRLYARGLPVWDGTTLDELSHTPPAKSSQQEMPRGLAPVFLINGNNLEVNISRRKVIDNRALDRLRKTAGDALSQLVEMAADSVSPRNAFQRFSHRFQKTAAAILRSSWKTLLVSALLILPLEYAVLSMFFKKPPRPAVSHTQPLSMQVTQNRYSGASVGAAINTQNSVNITYHPPVTTWFKLYHAETYRQGSGFTQDFKRGRARPFPVTDCSRGAVTVNFTAGETGTLLLPLPVGHGLDVSGVSLENQPLEPALLSTGGVVAAVPRRGVIRYRCCPPTPGPPLTHAEFFRLTQLPADLLVPLTTQEILDRSLELPISEKVAVALRLTAAFLKYDDSTEITEKYKQSQGRDWFWRISAIGAGDCDVLNAVTILFLRKLGVPSRLAVGLIGEKGAIVPGMHAWTEYFDNGWRTVDASVYTPAARPATAAAPVPSNFQRFPGGTDGLSATDGLQGGISTTDTSQGGTGSEVNPDQVSDRGPVAPVAGRGAAPLLYYLSGLVLVGFVLFVLMSRRRDADHSFKGEDREQVDENLAGMALHALTHPHAWGDDAAIRSVAILPTISGSNTSLHHALKLAKQGKLFYTSRNNPLVRHLQNGGSPGGLGRRPTILEKGHGSYDRLLRLIPGAVSLDRVISFKAVTPGQMADMDLGKLLGAVNRRLNVPCLPAPGLRTAEFFDVDLSPLPSLKDAGLPNRFIAVNPNGIRIKPLLELYKTNQPLALYKLAKELLKDSKLFDTPAEIILEKLSMDLLEKMK